MKTRILNLCLNFGLGLAAGIGLSGCASMDPPDAQSGPVVFWPTDSRDQVLMPVYTSPAVTPATNAPAGTNATQNGSR